MFLGEHCRNTVLSFFLIYQLEERLLAHHSINTDFASCFLTTWVIHFFSSFYRNEKFFLHFVNHFFVFTMKSPNREGGLDTR